MLIYQSHWRDDPKFDLTNTQRALPHLPCPELTYEALMRVARYPVERNFVEPRHERLPTDYDVPAHLRPLLATGVRHGTVVDRSHTVGLQVNGPGGGQWQLHLEGDRVAGVDWGLPQSTAACYYLSAAAFRSLANCELTVEQSINAGRLLIDGAGEPLSRLIGVFKQVVSTGNGVHRETQAMN